MSKDRRYQNLADPVFEVMAYHDACLVGSAAWWYIEGAERGNTPKDFDMIVKPGKIPEVNLHFKGHAVHDISVNSMGGLKAKWLGGLEVDYWEDTIRSYCSTVREMDFGEIAIVGLRPKFILSE